MLDEQRLQRVWYGDEPPALLLRLLQPVYRTLAAWHRCGWRWRGPRRLPVPVLVVGNITVGGTGKTPLVIALAEGLAARGWTPGIASRGYGGSQREAMLVPDDARPDRFGDEPCLMRQAGCARVAVGRDRAAAGRLLVEAGADLVIADDGLQHHALARDLEICVIDGQRRLGNGRLLPAGPLREPASRLQSVDWRVCNGGTPEAGEVAMQLVGDIAVALTDGGEQPLSALAGQTVHAVAGIGNPQRFFASLRGAGLHLIEHPFPDHHAYSAADFAFGDEHLVLMTDKDAIKCTALADKRMWRVPVRATLPEAFLTAIQQRLATRKMAGGS